MKYENSENRFWGFSLSWKTFLLNLFSCLINSFVINVVCKNLKQNMNIKVKSKHKVFCRTLYWKNWKTDSSSFSESWIKSILILMQLQDFKRIKVRGSMKNCFCFSLFKKNNWHLKAATGSCSVKKVFWGVLLPKNSRFSG